MALNPSLSRLQIRLHHPIVLVHGLGARSRYGSIDYFYGIPGLLREAGNRVCVANLSAWQTTDRRAEQLKTQIEEFQPAGGGKVNVLGHSLGGLDARYLISCLGFSDRVASLTTIGTPHRGSALSDAAQGLIPEETLSKVNQLFKMLGMSAEALKHLTTSYASDTFSKKAPDQPGVAYFSATSAIADPAYRYSLPHFWLSHPVLKRLEGENDGFVSVQSAKWGEHICTYRGDHYAQIGQILGRCRGMDYLAFYEEIFTRLKNEGL